MTVHSVIAIPMGVACMLAPAAMLANDGLALSPMGALFLVFALAFAYVRFINLSKAQGGTRV
jgi:hypothetical protein